MSPGRALTLAVALFAFLISARAQSIVYTNWTDHHFICGVKDDALPLKEKASSAARAAVIGARSVLVVRVDFSDAPGTHITEAAAIAELNSVNAFFKKCSFQQFSLADIAVTPILRMPRSGSNYRQVNNPETLAGDARATAIAAGFDYDAYDFHIFAFPNIGFSFDAIGSRPGNRAWIQGDNFRAVTLAHELGHNLGLPHANAWYASDDSIIGPGIAVEYGNIFDVMGNSPFFGNSDFNANFRYRLGWIGDPDIHLATTSGVYRVYAMDAGKPLDVTKRIALRVSASANFNGSINDYWIDVRQGLAYDRATNGIFIQSAAPFLNSLSGSGNVLLDLTPGSLFSIDKPLVLGRTFADTARGIYITPIKQGTKEDQLYLDVQVNFSPVNNLDPSVTVSSISSTGRPLYAIEFFAQASDPDGDTLMYSWDFGDPIDDRLPSPLNGTNVFRAWSKPGKYVVQCTVSDLKGGFASHSVVVQIGSPTSSTISGRVLIGTLPLRGVRVYSGPAGPDYRYTFTDSDGSYTLTDVPNGTYSVTAIKSAFSFSSRIVTVGPDATNVDLVAAPATAPFIIEVNPGHGLLETPVIISGLNFSGTKSVRFGDVEAAFTVVSPTEISTTVPSGASTQKIFVTTTKGTAASANPFVLDAEAPPVVVQAPQTIFVPEGSNAIFRVTLFGSGPLGFQWQKDGTNIPGATFSTLVITNATFSSEGLYSVTATNPLGSVTSAPARLTLLTLAISAGQPGQVWFTSPDAPWFGQTNVWLESSPGSASAGGADTLPGGYSAQSASGINESWIETTASGPALLTFSWQLSARYFDETLFFTIDGTKRAQISGTKNWSQVAIELEPGIHILRWTKKARVASTTAWLTQVRTDGVWFTMQPQSATLFAGDVGALQALSGGLAAYQWLRGGVPIPDATNDTIVFSPALPEFSGDYRVTIANGFSTATSVVAQLKILPLVISKSPTSLEVDATSNALFSVDYISREPVNFRWRFQNQFIPGATNQTLSFRATPADAGIYEVIITNRYGAVTSTPATLVVRSTIPHVDESMSEYEAYTGENVLLQGSFSAIPVPTYHWARNRRAIRNATNSSLALPKIRAGQKGDYALAAQNLSGTATQHVRVTVRSMTIRQQPVNQSVFVEEPVQLSVIVGSKLPVKYQWRFNGGAIPRATNATFFIASAQLTNSGNYSVVLKRGHLSLASSNALVTVRGESPAFTIEPKDETVGVGETLVLNSSATGHPAPSYQWYFNFVLFPFANSARLIAPWNTNIGGVFFAVASNQFGSATSRIAEITLRFKVPSPKISPTDFSAVAGDFVLLRSRDKASPPIESYQWFYNGSPISDATNSALALPAISGTSSDTYRIISENALGPGTATAHAQIRSPLALDLWQRTVPLPRSEALLGATFANGLFIAVGKSGTIITSTNATDWRDQSLQTAAHISSIAFATNRFMILIDPKDDEPALLVASNVTDWIITVLPRDVVPKSLAVANNLFIAGGSDTLENLVVNVSENGVVWRQASLPIPAVKLSVTYGNGRFVALAGDNVLVSSNATDWTVASSLTDARCLVFGNSRFVAAGDSGKTWTSTDGVAWTSQNSGTTEDLLVAGVAANRLVLAGRNGTLLISTDGSSWTPVPVGVSQDLNAFAANGQQAVLFGEAGVMVISASGGLNWSKRLTGATAADLNGVIFTNDIFVAVGDKGTLLVSFDGRVWFNRFADTGNDLNSITHGSAGFVAVGEDGAVIRSGDGIIWSAVPAPTSNTLRRVAFIKDRYMATGDDGILISSTNGTDWISKTIPLPGKDGTVEGVAYGNGLFLAVGGYEQESDEGNAHSIMLTSPDGVKWTKQTPDFGKKLRNIEFANDQFVAVGNDGLVANSDDGFQWRQQFIAGDLENLRGIEPLPGLLVVVGNDGIVFSSRDGFGWNRHRLFSAKNLHDIAYGKNMLVAVASDGTILRAEGVLPSLAAMPLPKANAVQFTIQSGAHEYYRLQVSDDNHTWRDLQIITNSVRGLPIVETNLPPAVNSFFRLQFP